MYTSASHFEYRYISLKKQFIVKTLKKLRLGQITDVIRQIQINLKNNVTMTDDSPIYIKPSLSHAGF